MNAAAERADDRLDNRLLPFAIFIVVLAIYLAAQRFLLRISNVEVERVLARLRFEWPICCETPASRARAGGTRAHL